MIDILATDDSALIVVEKLSAQNLNDSFRTAEEFKEYETFLYSDALTYQESFISKTFLLIEKETRNILAYISLTADTIALKPSEKKKIGLNNIPFLFLPALKIAKLAISEYCSSKYKHIGTYLVEFALSKAFGVNEGFMACRFISVDADIEHNPNVIEFYEKNGFLPLKNSIYRKKFPNRTKIVGMWKDIFS